MPKQKTTATRKTKGKGAEKKKKGMSPCHHFARTRRLTASKSDPNAPKRGLSAYMFFANEQRENVREENPGIAFGKYLGLYSTVQRTAPAPLTLKPFRPGWQAPGRAVEGLEPYAA